ncbi:MAG: D-alanyl-D-alanine carboxypeptidase [Chromatiaceae bacterium]|nr:D-alanyl-D-alanine carboxypeptidase [Chromatiaceae bacterium]
MSPLPFVRPRRLLAMCLSLCGALLLTACATPRPPEVTTPVRPALPLRTPATTPYSAIVVDAHSGKLIYAAADKQTRFPASLVKMMTLYLVFESLDSGRISKKTRIPISARAAAQPASKLYLKPGDTIDVDTAIRALVVKSANDVATAVAEHLGGSEANFSARMTAKARMLGMSDTTFRNASGLPDSGMRTTARDMATLGMALKRDFPGEFGYFSLRDFEHKGQIFKGHNRAMDMIDGADGIKTGFTRAAGFNLATSVRQDGRAVVAVVMGAESARSRDVFMRDLIAASLPKAERR